MAYFLLISPQGVSKPNIKLEKPCVAISYTFANTDYFVKTSLCYFGDFRTVIAASTWNLELDAIVVLLKLVVRPFIIIAFSSCECNG